jgi:AcrR family transcriptional regulator
LPRAGLTPEKVVREAATAVDDLGWDRLTLAAVAQRLGVRLPSLYKHIDSLDALRQQVAALATRELGDAMTTAALGRSGGEALRAIAHAYRAYGRSHPGRYAATIRAPGADDAEHMAAAEAVLRVVFAVLAGYGLGGDDAVDATRALRSAMHGFVTIEAAGGFGMPHDVDRSYERLITAFDTALSGWAA